MRRGWALPLLALACVASDASGQALLDPRRGCTAGSGDWCRSRTVWIGDSITFGFYTPTNRPPEVLQRTRGTLPVDNAGVNGETVQQMRVRWTNDIRPLRYGRLIFLGGVNNLSFTAETPATIWGVIKSTLDEAKADGMDVVPVTVLPFKNGTGWSAGRQTDLQTLNQSIRDWCTSNASTCVDGYAAMGDLGDPALLRWPGVDNIHPSDTGSQQLAAAVSAGIP